MRFLSDKKENSVNLRKHGLPFEIPKEVFLDPFCVLIEDEVIGGEQRPLGDRPSRRFGRCRGRIHGIDRGNQETMRIISTRKATSRECKMHEKV